MENSLSRVNAPSPRKQSGEMGEGVHAKPSSVSPFPSGVRVQAKLETTEVDDPLEREADTMADLVMRQIDTGSSGTLPPPSSNPRPSVSAFGGSAMTLPSTMESQLNASLGGGHALPGALRSQMEGAFGQPFSQVRVHTDSSSAKMNQGIGARAFTYGNDIFFNQGQYDPSSAAGQRLIAHELTHVAQQSGKVARESHEAASKAYVRAYFISNWHWGTFYTYLLSHHPKVVKALDIELDEGLAWNSWNEKRGTSFLEKVSKEIVSDIRKRRKLSDSWNGFNLAYQWAVDEFKTMDEVYGHELSPVFKALITITNNSRRRGQAHDDAKGISLKAQREAADNAPQEKVSFDGSFFDNSIHPISRMYRFLKEVYPEGLVRREDHASSFDKDRSIKSTSDISRNTEEFAELFAKHLDQLINKRFDAYRKKNNVSNEKPNFDRFLGIFAKEVHKHTSKYDAAWVLLNIVVDRQDKLYSQEFHVPDFLVSAETWTALFCEIMLQAASLAIGGPLFGQVVSNVIIRNPLARKAVIEAADFAVNFTINATGEVMRRKIRGQEVNVGEVLKAAGMSTLLNKGLGKGLDAAFGPSSGNGVLAGTLTSTLQLDGRTEESEPALGMESVTFDDYTITGSESGSGDGAPETVTSDDPEVPQVNEPGPLEDIRFDDPAVIQVEEPRKRRKNRKKKKPTLPDLDPGNDPDEVDPKKLKPVDRAPDETKPGDAPDETEPGSENDPKKGPGSKKDPGSKRDPGSGNEPDPGNDPENDPKKKTRRGPKIPVPGSDDDPKGEPTEEPTVDPKEDPKEEPTVEPKENPKEEPKEEPTKKPTGKDPDDVHIPDLDDLLPDFDFDIDFTSDFFTFVSVSSWGRRPNGFSRVSRRLWLPIRR